MVTWGSVIFRNHHMGLKEMHAKTNMVNFGESLFLMVIE